MDHSGISGALQRAADYIEAHGLQGGGFGRPGGPVCLNGAIAIGLDIDPSRLGWGPFFRRGATEDLIKVGDVVVASRLLDLLPPPVGSWERRRGRPEVLTAHQVLAEVARWSDAPGRTAGQAVRALRRAAFNVQKAQVGGTLTPRSLRAAA